MMKLTEQQAQAQAFAQARQQLNQRQKSNMVPSTPESNIEQKSSRSKRSQASSHKSKQSKKQAKHSSNNVNMKYCIPPQFDQDLHEQRAHHQANVNQMNNQQWIPPYPQTQFPNPFVPPNQYKEFIQF